MGGGGGSEVLPLEKKGWGGGGQVLTMLIGGMESFEVLLIHLSFSHTEVHTGAQNFPLLSWGKGLLCLEGGGA